MWGAISKDFSEFVSTVKNETSETLQAIDQNLDEPLLTRDNATNNTIGSNKSKRESLIDPDTGIPIDDVSDDGEGGGANTTTVENYGYVNRENFSKEWKSPENGPTVEEMRECLIATCSDVFCDELLVKPPEENAAPLNDGSEKNEQTKSIMNAEGKNSDVEDFLKNFDIGSKTDEISKLLKENDALKTTFSILATDQALISYRDFWMAYFYRIADDDRLVETYQIYYEKHLVKKQKIEATAEARNSYPVGLRSGVTSFLGGVVDRLTTESNNYDDGSEINESFQSSKTSGVDDKTTGPAIGTALGFLSTVTLGPRRPPFVLNTRVSDEDTDEGSNGADDNDDDSEEELGWDDDDDDDDNYFDDMTNDETGSDPDAGETTVEFKDAEKEKLLDDLAQARAERDSLQKTVELQTEELKKIKSNLPTEVHLSGSETTTAASPDGSPTKTNQLKMQLFEKESELAALRARLEDIVHENSNSESLQQELAMLKSNVASQELELDALRVQCKQQILEKEDLNSLLQEEITFLKQKIDDQTFQKEQNLNNNVLLEKFKKESNEVRSELETKILALKEETEKQQSKLKSLNEQHEISILGLKFELETSRSSNDKLQSKLRANEQIIVQLKEELRKVTASDGSSSTGVKVSGPDSSDDDIDATEGVSKDSPSSTSPVPSNASDSINAAGIEPSDHAEGDWGDDW